MQRLLKKHRQPSHLALKFLKSLQNKNKHLLRSIKPLRSHRSKLSCSSLNLGRSLNNKTMRSIQRKLKVMRMKLQKLKNSILLTQLKVSTETNKSLLR